MDKNKLLTPIVLRLMNDSELTNRLDGSVPIIKGPRKPVDKDEVITVNAPSTPMNADSTEYNGTILINYYCPNYSGGNARIEKMGPVAERIVELMHQNLLDVTGYTNYYFVMDEEMGPLFDSNDPEEHFMSIRIKYGLIKN
jgi:hypothetical protein